jgi:hypothetical protein
MTPTEHRKEHRLLLYKSFWARFWTKVEIKGPNACWPWKASRDPKGYGQFWHGKKLLRAHKVAFRWKHEPEALVIRHKCDNPPCCNPDHLLGGTHKDNVRDMFERGRRKILRGPAHPSYKPHLHLPKIPKVIPTSKPKKVNRLSLKKRFRLIAMGLLEE